MTSPSNIFAPPSPNAPQPIVDPLRIPSWEVRTSAVGHVFVNRETGEVRRTMQSPGSGTTLSTSASSSPATSPTTSPAQRVPPPGLGAPK